MKHSESNSHFQRYAPMLGTIIANFPTAVSFDPRPYSVETVSAGIRSAIRAKALHNWKAEGLNELLFLKHYQQVVVAIRGEYVIAGSVANVREYAGDAIAKLREGTTVLFKPGTMNDIDALCRMFSFKMFEPAIVVEVDIPNDAQRQQLSNDYDIEFEETSVPNRYKLI